MASQQARQAPSGQANVTRQSLDQAAVDMRAVAESSRIMARGWSELMQSWLELMERSASSQAQLMRDMLLSASMQQGLRAQQNFIRDNLRNLAEGTSMMLRGSGFIAEQAARPLAALAEVRNAPRPVDIADHERAQAPRQGERRRGEAESAPATKETPRDRPQ